MGHPRKLSSASLFRAPESVRPPAPARSITPVAVSRPTLEELARAYARELPPPSEPPPFSIPEEPARDPFESEIAASHEHDTAPPPPNYDLERGRSGIRSKRTSLPAAAVDEVVADLRRDSRCEED
jgi:hypothetical protein